jgi:hypothetical protein
VTEGEHVRLQGGADVGGEAQGLLLLHDHHLEEDDQGLLELVLVQGDLLHLLADFVFTQSC